MNPFTPHRRPDTLRGALRDGVTAALSIVIGGSLGFAAVTIAVEAGVVPGITIDSYAYQSADPPVTVQERPSEAGALVAAHDCWTNGEGMPADMHGEYPGHAVVTRPADGAPTYSAALVGPALDQVFGTDADTGLTVHAFCR